MLPRLNGLVAAVHTPFDAGGALNLAAIERQAAQLLNDGVTTAFIGGSTGECHSLSLDERRQLADRWFQAASGSALTVIVHAGGNCLADARMLGRQAEELGARAIAALAPSYFKPASVEALTACCAHIAEAAPQTPFYYYDIPALTGVHLGMADFLLHAKNRIPNLAGLKFTNMDLMAYQLCRQVDDGRFDVLWGVDEMLLAALACGATGAVGSTYNFAAPIYQRLLAAFAAGDLAAARAEQMRSINLIRLLQRRGYMASAKALMTMRGVDVGPPRLPHLPLDAQQFEDLRTELTAAGALP